MLEPGARLSSQHSQIAVGWMLRPAQHPAVQPQQPHHSLGNLLPPLLGWDVLTQGLKGLPLVDKASLWVKGNACFFKVCAIRSAVTRAVTAPKQTSA